MIQVSDHEAKILSSLGHGPYGRELVDILKKLRNQLCSLEGIERGSGDYSAQVEGRLLFKDLADELIEKLQFEKHVHRKPLDPDDFT